MAKKRIDQRTVRNNEANPLSDLMKHFIKANNLEQGFQKINVEEEWVKLMGPGVKSYTEKISLKGGTLIVKISSAALRTELSYGKEKILTMMNEALGEELIKKVILN
ncbi:DUF721 domain-containing protein [Wenyingzhuangia marina]|uniref:RNA-binding protein n=1 Tax=Wenyingzhuangia marina TaxID=1195760 RepID=A0A1M5V5B1_9FLAO|nr:DUF721 domain-containing protein [Wenyingzhuangia marina]GGF74312.1 hypothetical protein GCM10011397_16600 [Wenyingzhuangia marina]SHH70348.1 Protein of unknown function [Wenyingzhuangia marina]